MTAETKVIYHLEGEKTPYLLELAINPSEVKLLHLKDGIKKKNCRYYFEVKDEEFGVVKKEVTEDNAALPVTNGRVEAWISNDSNAKASSTISADQSSTNSTAVNNSTVNGSVHSTSEGVPEVVATAPNRPIVNESVRKFESVSSASSRNQGRNIRSQFRDKNKNKYGSAERGGQYLAPRVGDHHYTDCSNDGTSFFGSEMDTTSYSPYESEGFTTGTEEGSFYQRRHRPKRNVFQPNGSYGWADSYSSITESTFSSEVITVELNLETINFLGISIVGHGSSTGDHGIYVGSIMPGGAVAADGRIEPGDLILQVNQVCFENMSNEQAVHALRDIVKKEKSIKLVVAKVWSSRETSNFQLPPGEPIRPIDPSEWVKQTNALIGIDVPPASISHATTSGLSTLASNTNSSAEVTTTVVESDQSTIQEMDHSLTCDSDIGSIIRAMMSSNSGLDIRDRTWLKMPVPNSFLGVDLVDWLYSNVNGFTDRHHVKKYAASMLKNGFIRHTVKKTSFSEQCCYTIGDASKINHRTRIPSKDTVSNKSGSSEHSHRPHSHGGPSTSGQRGKKGYGSQGYSSYHSPTSYSDTASVPSTHQPRPIAGNLWKGSSKQSISTNSKSSRGSHTSNKDGRRKVTGKESSNSGRNMVANKSSVDKIEDHSTACSKGSNKSNERSHTKQTEMSNDTGNGSYKGRSGSSNGGNYSSPNRNSKDDFEMISKTSSDRSKTKFDSKVNKPIAPKAQIDTLSSTTDEISTSKPNVGLNHTRYSNDSNISKNGSSKVMLTGNKFRQSKETTFSSSVANHPNGITPGTKIIHTTRNVEMICSLPSHNNNNNVENVDKISIKSKDRR